MATLGPLLVDDANPALLCITHLGALALLFAAAHGVDPADRAEFTQLYQRVWQLFFLEYAIVPLCCLAG
jgi:homogentisate phytyltransferase/homogentisate geranylgeranyltransferase